MPIFVHIDGIPAVLRELQMEVEKDLASIIQEEFVAGLETARARAEDLDRVGVRSPHYKDSFRLALEPRGAVLSNDAPYAEAIEWGTRPYRLNAEGMANLREWAMGKLGLSRRAAGAVALAIADRIAEEGIKPSWVMRDTLRAMERNIRRRIRAYGAAHNQGRSPAALRMQARHSDGQGKEWVRRLHIST